MIYNLIKIKHQIEMKKLFCIFLTLCISASCLDLSAQVTYHPKNAPTDVEKNLDQKIMDCLPDDGSFEEGFSFAEWTATLHYHARKTLQRLSSEHVSQIAIEKEHVKILQELVSDCKALSPVAAEIASIHKIYQEEITYEKSAQKYWAV